MPPQRLCTALHCHHDAHQQASCPTCCPVGMWCWLVLTQPATQAHSPSCRVMTPVRHQLVRAPASRAFACKLPQTLCLKYCFIVQAELNTRVAAIKEAAAQRSFAAAPVITINVHVHVIADSARSTPCTLAVAELARRPDQAARHFLVARCIRTLPRPLPLVALLHFQAPSPDSAGQ